MLMFMVRMVSLHRDPPSSKFRPSAATHWAGMDAIPLFQERLTPMCTSELAASMRSVADLARVKLLHPGHSRAEWRCWLDHVGSSQVGAESGLVFDPLELTLTAAAQGHGVAIGAPQTKIRILADISTRLAQEDSPLPAR